MAAQPSQDALQIQQRQHPRPGGQSFPHHDHHQPARLSVRCVRQPIVFDEWGNPIKIVEENGAEHTYTYDTLNSRPYNRLTKKDPLGYVTSYAYDALGNVTTITPPRGALATITFGPFNLFNQPQVIKDGRGNYTVMKYDVKGNLLEEIKLRATFNAWVT